MAGQRRQQFGQQGGRLGGSRQTVMEAPRLVEAVAELAKVAGKSPPRRQASERPADIGEGAQLSTQPVSHPRVAFKRSDQVEPRLDPGPVEQGRAEIGGEQPRAGAGNGAVHRGEQAARPRAGRGDGQFQALPGGRVDHHMIARRARHRRAKEGQRIPRDLVEIGEQPAGGAQSGPVELAEAVQCRDLEPFLETALGGKAVEAGGPALDLDPGQRLGRDQLGGVEPGQLGVERGGGDRGQLEPARRDVGGGEAVTLPSPGDRDQPVGGA